MKVWEPSSHAMWAVWGIVQAKEDLLARIEGWKEKAAMKSGGSVRSRSKSPDSHREEEISAGDLAKELQELKLEQSKGEEGSDDEEEWDEVESEVFDYLSYAAERMEMFRRELASLGVI